LAHSQGKVGKNASIIFAMAGRMEQLNGKKDFRIICFRGILPTFVGIPVSVYNNRSHYMETFKRFSARV
jgi:ribosomal protein S19